jgi:F-type H+-transporting ATPase subunit beta
VFPSSDTLQLNVPLLRRRVPNLSAAARSVGIRAATVSDLCTGKIPIGCAEVKTLVGLAALAGCSVDELILRSGRTGMLETGIKPIDLLAPLVRGGVAGLIARAGVGQLVLVAELLRTLRVQRGFATLLWLPDQETPLPDAVVPEAGASLTDPHALYTRIAELRAEQDVFVVAERRRAMTGELLHLRSRLESEAGARPVTFALYDAYGDPPRAGPSRASPAATLPRVAAGGCVARLGPPAS